MRAGKKSQADHQPFSGEGGSPMASDVLKKNLQKMKPVISRLSQLLRAN